MLSAESIWITPPPPAREARFGNKSTPAAPPAESRLQMNFKSYGNNYPSGGANTGRNGSFGGGNGGFNGSQGAEDSERARQAHAALSHPYGDFHTYLHVYNTWENQNRSVQWSERNFVNFRSMKTVASIRYECVALINVLQGAFCRALNIFIQLFIFSLLFSIPCVILESICLVTRTRCWTGTTATETETITTTAAIVVAAVETTNTVKRAAAKVAVIVKKTRKVKPVWRTASARLSPQVKHCIVDVFFFSVMELVFFQ